MSQSEIQNEILSQILIGIERIERRFIGIAKPLDFLSRNEGLDKLDGIAMMLITIGESIKNFEKVGGLKYLQSHPQVDWKGIKGMRDILSHHYFNIDEEIVFQICTEHISPLKQVILKIKHVVNNSSTDNQSK